MKGLLIKDLKLMTQQKTSMIIIVVAGMIFTVRNGTPSYAIAYMSLLSIALAMGTLSYDELDHGMSFLMTLPVSRKLYVREKYLLGLAGMAAAMLVTTLMAFAAGMINGAGISIEEILVESCAMLCAAAMMMAVMMPVRLKYGPEKERVIVLTMVVIAIGVLYALDRIKSYWNPGLDLEETLSGFLQRWGNSVFLLPLLFVLVFLGISYQISVRIMERKEF